MKDSVVLHVTSPSDPREQRREPRRAAKGNVRVSGVRGDVEGQLVDVSESGFRMAHAESSFEPGQELGFQHAEAEGKARVIWNRINKGRVETGFFIVERV